MPGSSSHLEPSVERHLRLLGRFELVIDGAVVDVPAGCQRLIAFLALHRRPAARTTVASSLWLNKCESRAYANLRTSLWRLRKFGMQIVTDNGVSIAISPSVDVDYWTSFEWMRRILDGCAHPDDLHLDPTSPALCAELLPDWYDDWVHAERERMRQRLLHALDSLIMQLSAQGEYHRAIDVGLLAIGLEPFRETTHRAVIASHLAEGNRYEAFRQFERYRSLLQRELHVTPSEELVSMLAGEGIFV